MQLSDVFRPTCFPSRSATQFSLERSRAFGSLPRDCEPSVWAIAYRKISMTAPLLIGFFLLVAVIGNLLATYQVRDRLDRIAELLEKKSG